MPCAIISDRGRQVGTLRVTHGSVALLGGGGKALPLSGCYNGVTIVNPGTGSSVVV